MKKPKQKALKILVLCFLKLVSHKEFVSKQKGLDQKLKGGYVFRE